MIINRVQLLAQDVVGDNGAFVLFQNGSALASNKKSSLLVEGVPERVQRQVPLPREPLGVEAARITKDSAKSLLSSVPRDRKFNGLLEHAAVKANGFETLAVETTDGKGTSVTSRRFSETSDEVEGAIGRLMARTLDRGRILCLNRKRLLSLLSAMEKCCEDSSEESPVWIGISESGDISLRSLNLGTGQAVLGYMHSYDEASARRQPAHTEWERSLRPRPRRRSDD